MIFVILFNDEINYLNQTIKLTDYLYKKIMDSDRLNPYNQNFSSKDDLSQLVVFLAI